jgi:hypothetical protein
MRFRALIAVMVLAASVACGGGPTLFQDYEYEEEVDLSLDGSAKVYVNSSIEALNALRGSTFATDPSATIDRAAVSEYFSSDVIAVTRVAWSHRHSRRYLHVRMDVTDVRRLAATRPFNWSTYSFAVDGAVMVYRQTVGRAASTAPDATRWNGDEVVAFRVHLPSKVVYHNVDRVRRGNILVWEQPLTARLAGTPLAMDARIGTQSILYRTLGLFAAALLAVAVMFALVIWRVVKRSAQHPLPTVGKIGVPGTPRV